jgi:hypothetical protein
MDKKTKTIVIAIIAVVVIGGLYYGYNRWRQQRLANQILAGMYGVNSGLLGGLGTGNVSEQVAKEIAKQAAEDAAKQKADEAREAAKTPEDIFNATEEMPAYDANSQALVNTFKDIIDKVFGKSKVTSVSTSYGADQIGYGLLEFTINRLATGADLAAFNKVLTDKGLTVTQSGVSDKVASVVIDNDKMTVYFSFEIGKQVVSVNAVRIAQ